MQLFISSLGHARKLKFSSYVYLQSVNKMVQYRHALMILCNEREVYIFKDERYTLWEHVKMLISITNSYMNNSDDISD